jgi:hypothetical protein
VLRLRLTGSQRGEALQCVGDAFPITKLLLNMQTLAQHRPRFRVLPFRHRNQTPEIKASGQQPALANPRMQG